ncbi:MAG: hypothetical protein FJ030_13275 [Chloroflexi bacterium]|nr:hypothetical protein [Chloroflexota bacterium]
MPAYIVSLSRSYLVTVEAETKEMAAHVAEFFVGGEADLSTESDRKAIRFQITEIEMTVNDAIEVNGVVEKVR